MLQDQDVRSRWRHCCLPSLESKLRHWQQQVSPLLQATDGRRPALLLLLLLLLVVLVAVSETAGCCWQPP